MGKNVVVEGCSFSFSFGTGTVNIVSEASKKAKCSGKGIYTSPLQITVSNFTDGTTIAEGAGGGSITGSSTKATSLSIPVVLEGDNAEISITGVNPYSGVEVVKLVIVTISNAGQSEVKAI